MINIQLIIFYSRETLVNLLKTLFSMSLIKEKYFFEMRKFINRKFPPSSSIVYSIHSWKIRLNITLRKNNPFRQAGRQKYSLRYCYKNNNLILLLSDIGSNLTNWNFLSIFDSNGLIEVVKDAGGKWKSNFSP